jgi:hypothetical protein
VREEVGPVYVRRLVLEDVRGFRHLDFAFEQPDGYYAGWAVITGDNGSGKSALLKALALCLVGPDIARALEPEMKGWIRQGADRAGLHAQVVLDPDIDRFVDPGKTTKKPFWAELEVANGSERPDSTPVLSQPPEERRQAKGKRTATRGPWAPNAEGWFCAGYGPFRRLYGASQEAARLMPMTGPIGRFVSMFREDAALVESEVWAMDLHYRLLSKGDSGSSRVLEAVIDLLNDDLLPHGVRVARLDADGLYLADAAGVVLPLSEMSDGYRAAIALVIDILRHMVQVYDFDGLLARGDDGRLRVSRHGVILIDEIDAHLHPEWQRNIGFWLKEHFPKVQFIVTSHSPVICPAANERMVFHLPPPGSELDPFQIGEDAYWKIVRSRPDQILLTPAFGLKDTRSPFALRQRTAYSRLAAKKRATRLTPEEEGQLKLLGLRFLDEGPEGD